MNEMNDLIVKQTAERLFEANMMKCGFSYSPAGIYKAAFDEQGRLYRNWEARMKSCKPGAHEYPDLYRSPILKKGKRGNDDKGELYQDSISPRLAQKTDIPLQLPLSLRVDEDVSCYFEKFADEIGLTCSELMNLYLRQAKNEAMIPSFVEKINRRRKNAA